MGKIQTLGYKLINEAFTREGWVMYHQFMAGNRYVKGTDIVTGYYGHFKLNGKSISDEEICDMLHIDQRIQDVCDAIAPNPINSKYGRAFIAGVRWADEHPISKQDSKPE